MTHLEYPLIRINQCQRYTLTTFGRHFCTNHPDSCKALALTWQVMGTYNLLKSPQTIWDAVFTQFTHDMISKGNNITYAHCYEYNDLC